MSVRCVIQNRNTRIFSRCIHCLNKFSEEFVYIQVYLDGLILRGINISCSAFANFAFGVSFFSNYDSLDSDKDNREAIANFKISTKGLFHIFKLTGNIDKQVENCIIELNSNEFVTFILECKLGITKQFKLPIIDFEILQTFCTIDSLSNSISCNSKLISSAFSIFSKSDEVKMVLTKDNFAFRNYDEGIHNLNSSIHTQTSLDKNEFFTFNIKKETALIFCSREFRFILTLADQLGQDLDISCDSPSEPIIIKLKSDKNCEITFIISSIPDTATDSMRTNSIASPVASSQQFPQIHKSGVAPTAKIDISIEKNRSSNSTIFDFEHDLPAKDLNNSSYHHSKTNSLFSPQKTSASNHKSFSMNSEADIQVDEIDQTPQTPPLSQRFRAEILTDMNYDYFNESLENLYILTESDEEPFVL